MTDYSFQFGSFVFGSGTPWQIIDVDGIAGLPDIRVQDDNRGFNDGMFTGRDFYSGRTLTFTIHTFGNGSVSAHTNFQTLQAALIPQQQGTTQLLFKLSPSDSQRTIQARVRTRRTLVDPEYTFGFIKSQVTMFCPDPRFYDVTPSTVSLTPVPTSYGRTYNRTYNMTYGTLGSTQGQLSNTGTVYTCPTITLTGQASNPTFTYNDGSQTATIRVNVVMGATDVLVVNTFDRTVTLNGTPARNLVNSGSTWFVVNPGTTGTLTFTITNSPAVAPTAIISYSNAYV